MIGLTPDYKPFSSQPGKVRYGQSRISPAPTGARSVSTNRRTLGRFEFTIAASISPW